MIAFAYTNGHPRERITSVYFAEYRAGWLRHASGRLIARMGAGAIAPSRGDPVYNGLAKHASGWVWDVAIDSHGHPVIVYATFQRLSDHEYWYADWNGRRWASHFMTFAGPTISPGTIERQYSAESRSTTPTRRSVSVPQGRLGLGDPALDDVERRLQLAPSDCCRRRRTRERAARRAARRRTGSAPVVAWRLPQLQDLPDLDRVPQCTLKFALRISSSANAGQKYPTGGAPGLHVLLTCRRSRSTRTHRPSGSRY